MKRVFFLLGGLALVAVLCLALLPGLSDHDLTGRRSEAFDVATQEGPLRGTLWLPADPPVAALVLVHGDGAQDRTAGGAYAPLINSLLDRGIAVASWDKAGVGRSDGNWLNQSMADRQVEARTALQHLRHRFGGTAAGTAVGALGFSQAGWVLPGLSAQDTDFIVLIGAALNWQAQGDYHTAMRLRQEGQGQAAIEAELAATKAQDARIFGPGVTAAMAPDGMSAARWNFIRRNRHADATAAVAATQVPVFALWGAEDLNVDPERNAEGYRRLLADGSAANRVTVWPAASHGLLKAPTYNWQSAAQWSDFALLRFLLEGRAAYAPGALDAIADWITTRAAERR